MATSLEPIYDRLHGANTYHPFSANTFQDWATEAGDIVTISRGDDDYEVPVHSAHLSWHGSPQVVLNGTGNKERESIEKAAQRKYARGGGGYRASQMLYREFTDEDGLLHSSLLMSASELRTEFQASNSTIYSVITQTATEIRSEVGNVESGLQSVISQTASQIRSEVSSVESGIYSAINQTSSNIMLVVGKKANVFHQYIDPALSETVSEKDIWIKDAGVNTHGKAESFTYGELGEFRLADFYGSEIYVRKNGEWVKVGGDQLSEYANARLTIDEDRISIITDSMSGDYAEFIVELGRIHSEVEDVQAGLESTIEQTASMIRSAVWTANSEMYSEIIQTQSMIRSEVSNSESSIRSTITQTASGLTIEINRKRAQYIQATDPSLTNTMYNGDLWVIDNNIYTHSAMAALTHASLGTHALLDFYGKNIKVWKNGEWLPFIDERAQHYDEARLDINDREIHALWGDVTDQYAEFLLEKTQIRSIVEDKTNQLGSEILQTASEIRTSVWAANSQIYSSISQTASQIRTEVTNKTSSLQSMITQAADKISLVVQGTGTNAKIKAAEIVASINARTGQSVVRLSANQIDIDGIVSALNSKIVTVNTIAAGTANLGSISLESGGNFYVRESGSYWGYGNSLVSPIGYTIVDAEVDNNNTLHLYTLDGDDITFSKATTLTPSWSGSVLTVTATQTNGGTTSTVATNTIGLGGSDYGTHSIDLAMTQNGYPTILSGSNVLIPVKIVQKQGGGATTDRANTNLQYSLASLLQSKTATANGTVTPDSGYIGLSSVEVNISGGTIDIPSGQIYTSSTSRGTKLTTLKTRYEQARSDSDYVMFRVDCGGTSKWYYMEP